MFAAYRAHCRCACSFLRADETHKRQFNVLNVDSFALSSQLLATFDFDGYWSRDIIYIYLYQYTIITFIIIQSLCSKSRSGKRIFFNLSNCSYLLTY